MSERPTDDSCDNSSCGCGPNGLGRREFLSLTGLAAAGALLTDVAATAGPFVDADFEKLIPPDKKLHPDWVKSLFARGEPDVYTGRDLRFIGMPVGGIFCGTLYLGGDGKLWLWNIFNRETRGVVPKTVTYHGAQVGSGDGSAYVAPSEQLGPVEQGFAIRVKSQGKETTHVLDRFGFKNVTFMGQYPIGTITYDDPAAPVSVKLEAFSPFIPLNAADSGLPATVMSFTVKNTTAAAIEATLAGWLENAVCLYSRSLEGSRRNEIIRRDGLSLLNCTAEKPHGEIKAPRPDVVFEDWNQKTYEGWKVEGTAFGSGPIERSAMPKYQGDVGGTTPRVVNSHASAPGDDVATKDNAKGKLTSKPFTIDRNYLVFWIGGGDRQGQTCLNLVVNGKVVDSATGRKSNQMTKESFDVRALNGKKATIEIVDAATGGWGNIGVGEITLSDRPSFTGEFEKQSDYGTMALALLGKPAEFGLAAADKGGFAARPGAPIGDAAGNNAMAPLAETLTGAIGRKLDLGPGESATVNFVVAWHFPNYTCNGLGEVGRFYASRFGSAAAVATYVAEHFERLSSQTRLWRDTWNDSTLPHWFLNRTFTNTSILATTTCYRHKNGRFWAWEGIGCCEGTCTHVWHYAHAMARIFPEIERDERERVDLGLAMAPDGTVGFRAEFDRSFAMDGQAGVVLRSYREHQMSADDKFLQRNWPNIKRALRCIIAKDRAGDGILFGPLHNTLDAPWFGVVPWLVGLYHAALRASEEMAIEMRDAEFAQLCHKLYESGKPKLDKTCWNSDYQYFVQVADPLHPNEVGSYDGCHIDQVFGQSWADQVHLGRLMDGPHVKTALESLWKYNFTPDVGPFRNVKRPGRWYAMPGDGGLIMVTFPFKRERQIAGGGAWSAMYFNECMSGFEWQVAGHMLWEGLLLEGFSISRAIHDRYSGKLRNPYNEIECSDHYARAMASYGVFLAACGYEYHGPKGHLGFAPRLTPDNFKAPFTAAEGWGTFSQRRTDGSQTATIELKHGKLRLKTISLAVRPKEQAPSARVTVNAKPIQATTSLNGGRLVITFAGEVALDANDSLRATIL